MFVVPLVGPVFSGDRRFLNEVELNDPMSLVSLDGSIFGC